jgi:hypothetical protein
MAITADLAWLNDPEAPVIRMGSVAMGVEVELFTYRVTLPPGCTVLEHRR